MIPTLGAMPTDGFGRGHADVNDQHAHEDVGMAPDFRGHVLLYILSPMETTYRKRCKRYDIDGQAHCLTFSCFQRQQFFSKDRCCEWLIQGMQKGRENGMYDLWGYVIMPEHVHIVLLPKPEIKISHILSTIKQSVSKRALLWTKQNAPDFLKSMEDIQTDGKRHYRFWQRGGGYDRNLRRLEDVHEKKIIISTGIRFVAVW